MLSCSAVNNYLFLIFMEHTDKFTVPLPLMYLEKGNVLTLPVLDLSKKDGLFGIKLDHFVLALKQYNVSWYDAYWLIEQNKVCRKTPRLPDEVDCEEMRRHIDVINATARILRERGIDADNLDPDALYWLRREYSSLKAFAFMMKEHLNTLREKDDAKECLARVIWYD